MMSVPSLALGWFVLKLGGHRLRGGSSMDGSGRAHSESHWA
jgi:hypothetical protein